jgi:hypothetical protein
MYNLKVDRAGEDFYLPCPRRWGTFFIAIRAAICPARAL